jgi:hypothetical protein
MASKNYTPRRKAVDEYVLKFIYATFEAKVRADVKADTRTMSSAALTLVDARQTLVRVAQRAGLSLTEADL